jgi:carbon storage regulator
MLVLARKTGEAVKIGNNVIVKVTEIRGARVELAIDAPKHIPVNRLEIFESKMKCGQLPAVYSNKDEPLR